LSNPISATVNLNANTPAAPAGHANIIYQTDSGNPLENVSAFDPLMVGDNGSGCFSGNVPGPAAGDAAAGKYLKADGTWAVPTAPLMVGDTGSGGSAGSVPAPPAGSAAANDYLRADGAWVNPGLVGWSYGGNDVTGHWVKDPIGHIRQWGKITADINSTETSVGFPTNFTDVNSISVQVTTYSTADRITFVVNDGSLSTSGFSVDNNGSSGYAFWTADGY
jgi:hypothetical protein